MRFQVTGTLRISRTIHDRVLSDAELVTEIARGRATILSSRKNLVVNVGMQVFSRMLGGGANSPTVGGDAVADIADIAVASMELGNTPSPPTPANGDTTGVGSIIFQPALIVTYPDDYSVRFSGILPAIEAVGETITEEALRLKNGKVFAKRIFSTTKGSTALQFDHEFTFTRSP